MDALLSLATLTGLEIVLGIDNIIFIAILASRLPPEERDLGRKAGLGAALGSRLVLLSAVSWIVGLTTPLFSVGRIPFTGKSLLLLAGGLFLLWKATKEIHAKVEGDEEAHGAGTSGSKATLAGVITQITIIDVVFSIDSVITAVGMTDRVAIMVLANIAALAVMLAASRAIVAFVERHPAVKMLALSFLLLIGFTLMIEAVGVHIPKGYIYFAMAFSVAVECLNIKAGTRKKALALRDTPHLPNEG